MTTAIATDHTVDEDAADGYGDLLLAVAKMNSASRRGDTGVVGSRPHWRVPHAASG